MTWAVTQTYDVTWPEYERLFAGLEDDPPDGLYFHIAGPAADGTRVISVWESCAAYDAFVDRRLMPAAASAGAAELVEASRRTHRPLDVEDFVMAHPIAPASHELDSR